MSIQLAHIVRRIVLIGELDDGIVLESLFAEDLACRCVLAAITPADGAILMPPRTSRSDSSYGN